MVPASAHADIEEQIAAMDEHTMDATPTQQSSPELQSRLASAVGSRTCREIGELTGVHAESVRRYLQGRSPSAEFLVELCRSLKLNGHWLLTGEGPMFAGEITPRALDSAEPPALLQSLATSLSRWMDKAALSGRPAPDKEIKLADSPRPLHMNRASNFPVGR